MTSSSLSVVQLSQEKFHDRNLDIWLDGPEPLDVQIAAAIEWLEELDDDAIVLGIGGPRASEYAGIYDISFNMTVSILESMR